MNRLLLALLFIGSSSALKGSHNKLRRVQDATVFTNTNAKVAKDPTVTKEPKEPKAAKVAPEPKVKKEKKAKTCKKRPKSVPAAVGDGSATTQQISLPTFFGGDEEATPEEPTTNNPLPPPASGEITNGSSLPPPPSDGEIITNSGLPRPPPPPGSSTTNDNGLTAPGEGPIGPDANPPVAPEDLPWCPAVGKKVRSDAYCQALMAGDYPKHKSVRGMMEFDVMYDEAKPAVLEAVKDKIKKKTAHKSAGCKVGRRRQLEGEASTDNVPPPPPPEEIFISGVKFGKFDVQDKCDSHDSMEGCDKVISDVEILYETADDHTASPEEAEILFMEVMQSIQLEGFEGAVVENLNAEIDGSGNRSVSGGKAGAIAGGTLAAAAMVAGVAVYKRYGNDIAAKWG